MGVAFAGASVALLLAAGAALAALSLADAAAVGSAGAEELVARGSVLACAGGRGTLFSRPWQAASAPAAARRQVESSAHRARIAPRIRDPLLARSRK
jgi:hypothetical protein